MLIDFRSSTSTQSVGRFSSYVTLCGMTFFQVSFRAMKQNTDRCSSQLFLADGLTSDFLSFRARFTQSTETECWKIFVTTIIFGLTFFQVSFRGALKYNQNTDRYSIILYQLRNKGQKDDKNSQKIVKICYFAHARFDDDVINSAILATLRPHYF